MQIHIRLSSLVCLQVRLARAWIESRGWNDCIPLVRYTLVEALVRRNCTGKIDQPTPVDCISKATLDGSLPRPPLVPTAIPGGCVYFNDQAGVSWAVFSMQMLSNQSSHARQGPESRILVSETPAKCRRTRPLSQVGSSIRSPSAMV